MRGPIRGIEDNKILTRDQRRFLQAFSHSELKKVYRLSGGTPLSAFYLEHRFSEDLDFFSSEKIPLYGIEEFLKNLDFIDEILLTRLFDRNIFNLNLKGGGLLKVEFTYYPLKNLEEIVLIDSLKVDSFLDIVVNKLCAIADRFDAKDYVDLYWTIKGEAILLSELIVFAEKKCEIKGIDHILKSRLLQIPEGVENLSLRFEVRKEEIEVLFSRLIKDMISKDIKDRES